MVPPANLDGLSHAELKNLVVTLLEPTRSQNMTVSWRRSADAAVVSCVGVVLLILTSAMGAGANLATAFRMRIR
jgi:hypothetical protein